LKTVVGIFGGEFFLLDLISLLESRKYWIDFYENCKESTCFNAFEVPLITDCEEPNIASLEGV
jgi:hypothetical protein